MKRIIAYFVLFPFIFLGNIMAQNTLTLDKALEMALVNSFDIKLSENDVIQADNNQSVLNSGYLPSLTGAASGSYSDKSNYVVTQQGQENTIDGVVSKSLSGSIAVNYVLFNGKRRLNYKNVKKAYELADTQRKIQINNTLLDVYTAYYNLAKSMNQKDILKESLAISKERLKRIDYQFQNGQKTNLDVLNARVDVNNDSLNIVNSNVLIDNQRRNLNFLIGISLENEFSVENNVEVEKTILYNDLKTQMLNNNNQLKQIDINKSMSALNLKVNQSNWLPSVTANASYGFSNNDLGLVGFYPIQNSKGLSSGINLSWDLFDGGSTQTKVNNAKIALHNQDINKDKLMLNLENQLATYWADYSNQLFIIEAENLNVEVNNQNFLKTKEQFSLGLLNSLDFRQAQLNLINSKLNLSNAHFNAKIAETQLKRMAEILISDL